MGAASTASVQAQKHFEIALLHREKGRLEPAVRELQETLRLDPSAPAHGHLGVLLAELGRFDEAIAEFQAAVTADPADAGAYFRLAMLLAGRGRGREAISAYEGFIRHADASSRSHADFARQRIAEIERSLAGPAPRAEPPVRAPEPAPLPARPAPPMLEPLPSSPAEPPPKALEPSAAPSPPVAPTADSLLPVARRPSRRLPLAALTAAAVIGVAAFIARSGAGGRATDEPASRPQAAVPGLAAAIEHDMAKQRLTDAVRDYHRVTAALDAAQARGVDVSALRARLPEAVDYLKTGQPEFASVLLNAIELRIPLEPEGVRPAEKESFTIKEVVEERRRGRETPLRKGRKPLRRH